MILSEIEFNDIDRGTHNGRLTFERKFGEKCEMVISKIQPLL